MSVTKDVLMDRSERENLILLKFENGAYTKPKNLKGPRLDWNVIDTKEEKANVRFFPLNGVTIEIAADSHSAEVRFTVRCPIVSAPMTVEVVMQFAVAEENPCCKLLRIGDGVYTPTADQLVTPKPGTIMRDVPASGYFNFKHREHLRDGTVQFWDDKPSGTRLAHRVDRMLCKLLSPTDDEVPSIRPRSLNAFFFNKADLACQVPPSPPLPGTEKEPVEPAWYDLAFMRRVECVRTFRAPWMVLPVHKNTLTIRARPRERSAQGDPEFFISIEVIADVGDVLRFWNAYIAMPYLKALPQLDGGASASVMPYFTIPTGQYLTKWNLRFRAWDGLDGKAVEDESVVMAPAKKGFFAVSEPVLEALEANPIPYQAELNGFISAVDTHVTWQAAFSKKNSESNDDALWPQGLPQQSNSSFAFFADDDKDVRGGIALLGCEILLSENELSTAQVACVRCGALDLKFPQIEHLSKSPEDPLRRFSFLVQFQESTVFKAKIPKPARKEYMTSVDLRAAISVLDVSPGSQDDDAQPSDAQRSSVDSPLVLDITRLEDLTPALRAYLDIQEYSGGKRSHELTMRWMRKAVAGDETRDLNRRIVILDRTPFLIAHAVVPFGKPLNDAESNEVGLFQRKDGRPGWELANDDAIRLLLPPQAVGEAMVKDKFVPGYPQINTKNGKYDYVASDVRFSPPAVLKLTPSALARRYQLPVWDLRKLFGRAGQEAPGALLNQADFELLFGMRCSVTTGNLRIAELGARTGDPVTVENLRRGLPWVAAPTFQKTIYEDFRSKWARMLRLWNTRLGVLEPYDDRQVGDLVLTQDIRYSLRGVTAKMRPGEEAVVRNPFSNWNTAEPAPGPDKPEERSAQWLEADRTLPGGATWGIAQKGVYSEELIAQPFSTAGRLLRPRFSALGGWGFQEAVFNQGMTKIKSDTQMGRVSFYSVERIGRIANFYNRAKHVLVYERSVIPTLQFRDEQKQHVDPMYSKAGAEHNFRGLPLVRKVKEFIELLQPVRYYPDLTGDTKRRGFLLGCMFKSKIIPVSSAWSTDLVEPEGMKKPDAANPKRAAEADVKYVGWVVPLWRRGEDDRVYPKPQILLQLQTGSERETLDAIAKSGNAADGGAGEWVAIDDPEKLVFYTKVGLNTTAVNTDEWPAVEGVDYSDIPTPTPECYPSLNESEPDAKMEDAPAMAPLVERFTYTVQPSAQPVNMIAARVVSEPIRAIVRNVTLSRATHKDTTTAADAKQILSLYTVQAKVAKPADLALIELQKLLRTSELDLATAKAKAGELKKNLNDQIHQHYDEFIASVPPDVVNAINGTGAVASGALAKAKNDVKNATVAFRTNYKSYTDELKARLALERKRLNYLAERKILEGVKLTDELTAFYKSLKQETEEKIRTQFLPRVDVLQGLENARRIYLALNAQLTNGFSGEKKILVDDIASVQSLVSGARLNARDAVVRLQTTVRNFSARANSALAEVDTVLNARTGAVSEDVRANGRKVIKLVRDALLKIKTPLLDEFAARKRALTVDEQALETKLRQELDNIVGQSIDDLNKLNAALASADLAAALETLKEKWPASQKKFEGCKREFRAEVTGIYEQVKEARMSVRDAVTGLRETAGNLSVHADAVLAEAKTLLDSRFGIIPPELQDRAADALNTARGALGSVQKRIQDQFEKYKQIVLEDGKKLEADSRAELDQIIKELNEGVTKLEESLKRAELNKALDDLKKEVVNLKDQFGKFKDQFETEQNNRYAEYKDLLGQINTTNVTEFFNKLESDIDAKVAKSLTVDAQAFRTIVEAQLQNVLKLEDSNITNAWKGPNSTFHAALDALDNVANAGDLNQLREQGQVALGHLRVLPNELNQLAAEAIGRAKAAAGIVNTLNQEGSQALSLMRAFADSPTSPTLAFNREKIGYYFHKEVDKILTTPVGAMLERADNGLKALGIRLPTNELRERMVPNFDKINLGTLLPDFAGLKLEKLLEGVHLEKSFGNGIKLTQGIDPQTRRPWVNCLVDIAPPGRKQLFKIGPLAVFLDKMHFTALSRMEVSGAGASVQKKSGRISSDWIVEVGGMALITFEQTALNLDEKGKITFDVSADRVKLPGVLQFVSDWAKKARSLGGLDNLKERAENVIKKTQEESNDDDAQNMDLPRSATEPGSDTHPKSGFWLEWIKHPTLKIPVGVAANFAKKEKPFACIIYILGGAGYVDLQASYWPMAKAKKIDFKVGIYLSAAIGFAFGPAKGSVAAYLGITFNYIAYKSESQMSFAATFILRGDLDIAGFITVSIMLILELVYESASTGQSSMLARGRLSMKIKICWCFTFKFTVGVEYRMNTSSDGQKTEQTQVERHSEAHTKQLS